MSLNCNARTIRSKKSEPVYSTDECLSKNIQQNAFALAKMMAAQWRVSDVRSKDVEHRTGLTYELWQLNKGSDFICMYLCAFISTHYLAYSSLTNDKSKLNLKKTTLILFFSCYSTNKAYAASQGGGSNYQNAPPLRRPILVILKQLCWSLRWDFPLFFTNLREKVKLCNVHPFLGPIARGISVGVSCPHQS